MKVGEGCVKRQTEASCCRDGSKLQKHQRGHDILFSLCIIAPVLR